MSNQEEKCAGFIQLQFIDSQSNQVVSLGGAGFKTKEADDAAWAGIPEFCGETEFIADRLDGEGDIVDDRPIAAETCEALMGKPIAQLITESRANLKAALTELKR